MTADMIHAGLGILFTVVWLMIGQIVAADR
jgi:hypothetical protein